MQIGLETYRTPEQRFAERMQNQQGACRTQPRPLIEIAKRYPFVEQTELNRTVYRVSGYIKAGGE